MKDNRLFKASVIEYGCEGWIADLSPAEAVMPSYYWRFRLRRDAKQFLALVDCGVSPHEAMYNVYRDFSTMSNNDVIVYAMYHGVSSNAAGLSDSQRRALKRAVKRGVLWAYPHPIGDHIKIYARPGTNQEIGP